MIAGDMPHLVRRADQVVQHPESGLSRQILAYTAKLMLVRHQMEKGWNGACHRHPHEQLVYVIRGHIRVQLGGKTIEASAGDSFVVPGGMDHEAFACEESEVLDVFTPYRDEYVEGSA